MVFVYVTLKHLEKLRKNKITMEAVTPINTTV